ncbi:MAG: peptidylprolyl isomerase, partial [Woeseiaceae bacterium]
MKNTLISLLLILTSISAAAADKVPAHPHIEMVTSLGTIKLELDGRQAPLTVAHVLALVDAGFYDGTIFHRVIPGFMAQGGGYTPGLKLKETEDTLANESGNGLTNVRGTIAMARTADPHSANSQFFINVADNDRLDPTKAVFNGRWGYTVFGSVIEGMEVVDE